MSRRRHGGGRHPIISRQEGATLVTGSRRDRCAPHEGPELEPRLLPAPAITREAMAQQLSKDPEFRAWASCELRARWAGR